MGRFWNLQTKFVVVLMLLLLGSFGVQSYVHGINESRLLDEVATINEELAEEVTQRVAERSLTLVHTQLHVKLPVEEIKQAIPLPKVIKKGREWQLELDTKEFAVALRRTLKRELKRMEDEARVLAEMDQPIFGLERDPDGVARARQGNRGPYTQNWRLRPTSDRRTETLEGDGDPKHDGDPGLVSIQDKFNPAGASDRQGELGVFDAQQNQPLPQMGSSSPVDALLADEPIDLSRYTDRFQDLLAEYRRHDLLATVGIFLMGIAFAWLLGVRMTKPVHEMVDGFRAVSDGDLEVQVSEKNSGEFGLLGRQFNEMVERLRESRNLQRELEQRERVQLMGDLAAGVAHDVRNPLNAIHLNIGQIRDEFLPDDERSQERFVRFTSDVQTEVNRLNQLVTNFLSLARPTSEDLLPTEPNQLLSEMVRLISKEAAGRSVEVVSDLDDSLPVLMWNRQEMMSAFLNVAINGLQSMEPDGGVLTIRSRLRNTEDSSEERAVCVSFCDSGRGIPEDEIANVFIPYYTTRKGGTGLGMAIARRVAERNGGSIEVKSREGEGTTVEFVFPEEGSEELLRERTLAS